MYVSKIHDVADVLFQGWECLKSTLATSEAIWQIYVPHPKDFNSFKEIKPNWDHFCFAEDKVILMREFTLAKLKKNIH